MDRLDETQLRASFVNATKGEVTRMNIPCDLEEQPWAELGLLSWVDPKSPLSGYLVVTTPDRGVTGVRLKRAAGGETRRARMCSLCTTTQGGQGVALMVAPRAGRLGRNGNTVGAEMCASLACSDYARGLLRQPGPKFAQETLSVEERVARLSRNAVAFVDKVLQ